MWKSADGAAAESSPQFSVSESPLRHETVPPWASLKQYRKSTYSVINLRDLAQLNDSSTSQEFLRILRN